MKHKCKRISAGHYLYRGFEIICVGYYNPEHRVCWEAVEKDGLSGFGQSYSLKETKKWVDYELDERFKK